MQWYERTLVKVDTLPIVKVVLDLPGQKRRTQVARPLAMCKLQDRRPARAEGRSVIVCGDTVRLAREPKHMSAKHETSFETCGNVAW
jgi:hypothetical protein